MDEHHLIRQTVTSGRASKGSRVYWCRTWMMAAFIIGSCIIKIASVSLAGRFAGFRGLDLINLAITTNARGGPGIVLASVAFDAGIISAKFYTILVLAAVLTSQLAGAWLDYACARAGHYWHLLLTVTHRSPHRKTARSPLDWEGRHGPREYEGRGQSSPRNF